MKVRLTIEIAIVSMAIIVLGTWQGWLKWPEGSLMAAVLCLVTALVVLRRTTKKQTPET